MPRATPVLEHLTDRSDDAAVVITPIRKGDLAGWLEGETPMVRAWVESVRFSGEAGSVSLMADDRGSLRRVLFGLGDGADPWVFAHLPGKLPPAIYRIEPEPEPERATWAATAWSLATYAFDRYRGRSDTEWPRLAWPAAADRAAVERVACATALVRDLVNIPAGDLGPAELTGAVETVASHHAARCRVLVGEELLRDGYPMIHAVGRASARAPRLADLVWGDESAPKVTIVGKGVVFDSGGLDIKPASGMKLMKKDMGGAAHALGLAKMVMTAGLPVRLRVLIPAVENAVSGSAFRPLDVLRSRKGLSVEVGNTDAEGRLVLADALTDADSEKPDLLLDFATLTGAARTALGPELPALFSNDDALAEELLRHGREQNDPMWRLPLWSPYRRMLDSKVADINNASDSPFAGAITAALFLQEFVSAETPWAHLDLFAWNPATRPGRPEGGEAMTLRAAFALLAARFGA